MRGTHRWNHSGRSPWILAATSALLCLQAAQAAPCKDGALVSLDDGAEVNVEWPARTPAELKSRALTNSTLASELRLALRPDGSVSAADVSAHTLEGKPVAQHFEPGPGAVFWSDRFPSTLEQIVKRARASGRAVQDIPLIAASKDVPGQASVEQLDAIDWVVTVGPRRYDVFTDEGGCMLGATLASYGMTFERRDLPPGAHPLEGAYAAPPNAPYTATDVKFPAPQGHSLGGTLTRPTASAPAPAVVMITGISKHERNEGTPPYTPFRDIADVLGRAGIAVLRIDDRGVGASTGDFDKATSFDEADDVRTEVAWLRKQPGIDPKRVGLVGHSEGAFIAAVVAATDPSLAAIALLAGSGVPGEQLNTWQTTMGVEHDPTIPAEGKAAEIRKELADRSDWSARDKAFVASDPLDYARTVKVPALMIQGGADLHVAPRSAERLAAAMRSNGNRDVTVLIIPHLSHTLCPDVVGTVPSWTWLPSRRLSNQVLRSLQAWLVGELKP